MRLFLIQMTHEHHEYELHESIIHELFCNKKSTILSWLVESTTLQNQRHTGPRVKD